MALKLTQTKLAEEFGLSSVAMGKKLVELQLRDPVTKLVTANAYNSGLGKNISYIKDDKEVNMAIWNEKTIKYIQKALAEDFNFQAQCLLGKIKALKKIEDEDDGSKRSQWLFDSNLEEFSESLNGFKKNEKVLNTFIEILKKEKLLTFAEPYLRNEDIDCFID